ncbi:MAG: aspartate aminotransferase family protein [Flavipsychrobacter sp.]|nr:aspartate aminotransferase family protein [Flavipsychrobacter sp.]
MNTRELFLRHVGQTSPSPVALSITGAKGNYLHDERGDRYLDLIGGISVCNVGHGHPEVIAAVQQQAEKYLHVMVYGELVQSPQVTYAHELVQHLPPSLDCVYFTNSGAEAVEGALKLARRVTGKTEVIACNRSYHGSTTGALALIGDEYWRNAFRPLMPGVGHYEYNSQELIDAVTHDTACVVIETVQAEAGVIEPRFEWLQALHHKCTATGTLLIFDEIQCGFGRTGAMWGFQHYGIVPDILLLGKALGGGLPLGAFVAAHELMYQLTNNPVLGHITTFGGHPLSCAAGLAAFRVLASEQLVEQVKDKEQLFHSLLKHPAIKAVRSKGLLMAIELESSEMVLATLQKCLEKKLFSDWFLFAAHCIRIAPPLTISEEEIAEACKIITSSL